VASTPDPSGHGGDTAGPEQGGDYEVGAPIREGWGGTIHDGWYRRSGLRVTVQDIRPDLAATPGLIDRLGRLGRDAATVRDPHLLAVYDLVDDGRALRLVAEWTAGDPLAAMLRRGALAPERALAALGDILAGLVALHGGGLFHGQVGPETVMVDSDGRARLAELALGAAAAPAGSGAATDVRDAARLGRHLLRGSGSRFDRVRRPLDAAATGMGAADAAQLRGEVDAAAAAVLGESWRQGLAGPSARSPTAGRRPRRGRLLAALAALIVVAAAALAAFLLIGRGAGGRALNAPLVIGNDATLGVAPVSGGCNTTFSFIARGSLSGSGTLVYRWEQSDGQITDNTSLPITASEGAFQLSQAWRLQGSQTVHGTMTLHLLKPTDRRISRSFTYSCP
jgi:hypothetical protein